MERYKLTADTLVNWWVITDNDTGIRLRFKENDFNESQEAMLPEGFPIENPDFIARLMRELGDWAVQNCSDLLFPKDGEEES